MGQNLGPLNIQDSYQALVQVSGSQLTDGTGSLLTSLDVSASYASRALTASFAENVVPIDTGSLLATASYSDPNLTFTKGDGSTFNVEISTTIDTGSFVTTASVSDATLTFTKGDGSTFDTTINNVSASISASYASTASQADNANNADQAELVEIFGASNSSNYRVMFAASNGFQKPYIDSEAFGFYYNPSTNVLAGLNSVTATTFNGLASSAVSASFATTASYAVTADTASFLPSDTNLNINSISASSAVFQSASIGYLQTITGSATIIGDNYIILNTSDATRYAGIAVEDSGSATPVNYTASFNFDSQTNDWFYEYTSSGDPDNFGVAMFGPEYGTKGSPIYPTANTLVKGNGGHHLLDSSITDDGTLVTIDANVSASGYVSASAFAGDGSGLTNLPVDSPGLILGGTATSLASTLTTTPATASGAGDVAIGNGAIAQGGDAISIGNGANATKKDAQAIAIGSSANASFSTMALGYQADSENYGISIGHYSSNRGGVSLGRSSTATGGNAVALGGDANVAGSSGVAIGAQANAANNYSVAIGALARATGSLSFVVTANQADLMTATTTSQDVQFYGAVSASLFQGNISNATSASVADQVLVTPSYTSSFISIPLVSIGGILGGGYADLKFAANNNLLYKPSTGEFLVATGSTFQVEQNAIIGQGFPDQGLVVSGSVDITGSLEVVGKVTGNVNALSITSNTASMDCSAGNFFTLTLANGVDTHLDATNIASGQTINLKVTNNATAAGTLSFAPEFEFVDGTAFEVTAATSSVDVMTFISFDGTSLQATGLKNFS